MLTKLLTVCAILFGLCFLTLHILFIYQFVDAEKYSAIYISFWRTFISFFAFSTLYPVMTTVIALFKRKIRISKSFIPMLINMAVFISLCATSMLRG